jgi:hypothetical protein
MEFEMSEIKYKFDRDSSLDDLDSVILNIDSIPSMNPKLNRSGFRNRRRTETTICRWSRSGSGTSARDS